MSDPSFKINEIVGNLFSCPSSSSLGHCVSSDFKMGKGIAVKFRQMFGQVEEMKRQKPGVGEVVVLEDGDRFVYNLVTKDRYFNKPTYDTLKSALLAMRAHIIENSVRFLCLPKIGCGLDRLKWNEVKKLLQEIFKHDDIDISVYSFEENPVKFVLR